MHFLKSALLASTLLTASTLSSNAEINVVASIKPVHSLVASVMQGVGTPELIVDGAGSPHTYALKPSQAQVLEDANLVFWVGHELEAFLEKPLEAIATKAKKIELLDAHDLTKHKFREGGAFEEHAHEGEGDGHDDHGHKEHAEDKHDDHDHDKHAEDKHDDHDHDKHAEDKHDDHDHDKHAEDKHDGHDHSKHGAFDPHIWLDPVNAKTLVHEIEEALSEADPANAKKYEANAEATMQRLDALTSDVSEQLLSVKDKKFVVFHDAYQGFEKRFNLSAIGSITVSPEVLPGAERIKDLQSKIVELNASCVFAEPQFEPRVIMTVTEGTNANTGVIDPLGTSIENGPELYFTLIRNMATSFETCLSKAS